LDIVQVQGKLQQVLQLEIPLRELFQHPTIRLLAHYLSQKRDESRSFVRHMHQRTQDQQNALQRRKEQMQRRRKSDG
jgi:hypothetical protein